MIDFNKISTFFVSAVSGSDSFSGHLPYADGTGNGPYQTIERAIEAISECRRNGVEHPLTVSLVDGYFTASTIRLSGSDGVTIESYGTQKRIVGGYRIENWEADTMNGKKCLSARIPEEIEVDFNVFYVNGERADVTRFPESGTLRIVDADHPLTKNHPHANHSTFSSKWFRVSADDLRGLDGIDGAMIHYTHYWIDEHSPIESYDPTSGMLTMAYSSRFSIGIDYEENPHESPKYYLTNIPNCFRSPGQWYLNRTTRRIYYIPKREDMTVNEIEAIVPVVHQIFEISGEDIYIKNLELTCTKGDYASTVRYPSTSTDAECFASDIQSCCTAPGAIRFRHAKRCGILNCSVHGLGVYGIELLEDCHNVRIEDNHIYDTCAGAVKISGGTVADPVEQRTSDCLIRKNHIHGCGKRYLAGCAILITDAHNCEISENEIHDTEYSGISVGWVWGYADSATYGIVIKRNHIYEIGKGNLSDLGGIYMLGKQRGSRIFENIIHDVKCAVYGAWGIYLDEGSSFMTVEKNIVYNTDRESFHMHYGSHNTVKDNLFFGKNSCVRITREEDHAQLMLEGNLLITQGAPIYGGMKYDPSRMYSNRNILCDPTHELPLMWTARDGRVYDPDAWRKTFEKDTDSLVEPSLEEALRRYGTENPEVLSRKDIDIKQIILGE